MAEKKVGKKQCKTEGCRKRRREDSDYCASCAEKKANELHGGNGTSTDPVFAEDHVLRLTEAELDKFNLLRLKMEKMLQSVRVNELELDKLRREFRDQEYSKEQLIKQQRAMIEPLNNEYLAYVRKIAEKYALDPNKMGIEDETGVLQDLRQEATKSG